MDLKIGEDEVIVYAFSNYEQEISSGTFLASLETTSVCRVLRIST